MMRRDFLKTIGAGLAGMTAIGRSSQCAPITAAEAAQELLRRRKARSNLLDFTLYTKPDYRVNWHHRITAAAIDRVINGQCKRLMIFQPPQTGKSEQVNRRLPALLLGINPDLKILSSTHNQDLARDMNRDVQRIIDDQSSGDTAPYRNLFPGTRIAQTSGEYRRTMDYFQVVGHDGCLRSAGVGQGIAGKTCHFGVIDDPFGLDEDAQSPAMREKTWNWFCNDFMNRLSKDAPVILTHTRWHSDDLAGRLLLQMAERGSEQWDVVCLPSIRTETLTHPDDPRQVGDALWPDHKSIADLLEMKRKNPRGFAAIHQQDPHEAGCEFPAEWFGPEVWFDEWPPAHMGQKIITLDSSKGKSGKKGDYSAILSGQWYQGRLWVDADMSNVRNSDAIVVDLVERQRLFRAHAVGVEEEFGGDFARNSILRHGSEAGVDLSCVCLISTGGVNKEVRIRRLTTRLADHMIRFKADSSGARLLVQQLKEFPNGDHDDGPDALEMMVRLLSLGGIQI